ncbi:MAG: trimethylamine methyltransferase family protein, partial [Pseudomonadota bacterium]
NRLCEVGGMMGSLMGCSFESMVIDNDIIGAIARTLRGIEITDDTLSVDTIHECATGPGHYLGHGQTLEVMETEYVYPNLMNRSPVDQWQAEGSKDLFEHSQTRTQEILGAHVPNYLSREADAKIRLRFPIKLEAKHLFRPRPA